MHPSRGGTQEHLLQAAAAGTAWLFNKYITVSNITDQSSVVVITCVTRVTGCEVWCGVM
jgi:hypothetical protein